MLLDGKVSASVDVVSGLPQGSLFRTIVVYIVHFRALPYCWESYCGLYWYNYGLCSHS